MALGDAVVAEEHVVGLELLEHGASHGGERVHKLGSVVERRHHADEGRVPQLARLAVDLLHRGACGAGGVLREERHHDNLVAAAGGELLQP